MLLGLTTIPITALPAVVSVETCESLAATIVGTSGPDFLVGTSHDDVIVGRAGDDVLRVGGGDDVICGDPGDDTLTAGHGSDTVRGGPDADTLRGGAGRDLLTGGSGSDTLLGGVNPDTCRSGELFRSYTARTAEPSVAAIDYVVIATNTAQINKGSGLHGGLVVNTAGGGLELETKKDVVVNGDLVANDSLVDKDSEVGNAFHVSSAIVKKNATGATGPFDVQESLIQSWLLAMRDDCGD